MNRQVLSEKIVALKQVKGLSWKQLAEAIGRSPGFATAARLLKLPNNLALERPHIAGHIPAQHANTKGRKSPKLRKAQTNRLRTRMISEIQPQQFVRIARPAVERCEPLEIVAKLNRSTAPTPRCTE
jgi:hypothetical protein